MRHRASFAAMLLSSLTLAAASSAQTQVGVVPQFMRFADVYGGRLVMAFDSIPASQYGYRPTPSQQSVGYIAQHLENANYNLCGQLGAKHPRTAKDSLPDTVKALWPKDTLVARLDASLKFCDGVLQHVAGVNTAQVAATMLGFETDLAEHYSQISVYMRLLGLVPPSALPAKTHTAIALPESALQEFVGRYRLSQGWEIAISLKGGALSVQSNLGGEPARLWPESPTTFFVKEIDAGVTFTRGSNGAVNGLVVHQFNRERMATKLAPSVP